MTPPTLSTARWLALPVLACLAALGCGGTFLGSDAGSGAGGSGHSEGGVSGGPPCGHNESCPSGSTCFFPIGSCDAKGVCVENPPPGTPECNAIELVCGCGKEETTGCGFPSGFASGPTTGSSSDCAVAVDAGPPGDATVYGPCGANGACPSGSSCLYPIGSCGTQPVCVENLPDASAQNECNALESLCGCGTWVTTGCGFPIGYATGATLGSQDCGDAGYPTPDAGTEAGTDLGPCGANGACPSGSVCFYPIGNCDAKGECIVNPPPGAPVCNAEELVCGCGTNQTTGCGYPNGYASGPTTGTSSCAKTP